jgi:betaine-aldehyde dehydrogenase
MQTHDRLFIGGSWVPPSSSATLDVISPHTEEVIARVPEAREADVDRAVAAAREAFDRGPWPRMTPAARADLMAALLERLQTRANDIAVTITQEMGSPISFSHMGQVMAANMVLDYYVRLAREYRFEDVRSGMLGPCVVRREPVGVAACIIPWNVPLFVIMLKLGPALAAGATVVIKPAPETPLDAMMLAEAVSSRESRRASSTSSPRAARSASTSSVIRASTRSRSPAAPPRDGGSVRSAASS